MRRKCQQLQRSQMFHKPCRTRLFNDLWFDKEHALCIALNSLEKSERRLAGRCNSVEH